jgi:hypothetical protein
MTKIEEKNTADTFFVTKMAIYLSLGSKLKEMSSALKRENPGLQNEIL